MLGGLWTLGSPEGNLPREEVCGIWINATCCLPLAAHTGTVGVRMPSSGRLPTLLKSERTWGHTEPPQVLSFSHEKHTQNGAPHGASPLPDYASISSSVNRDTHQVDMGIK